MPHPPPTRPLTLIVATTPIRTAPETTDTPTRLGIGLKGTLPWPRIKSDMSFFARVTSRAPAPGTTNAIIMGRKTYESVPKHLRPLAKRISVIVTRDASGSVKEGVLQELEARKAKLAAVAKAKAESQEKESGNGNGETAEKKAIDPPQETIQSSPSPEPITDAIVSTSLGAALHDLDASYGAEGRLGKIYVIGGAEIYGAALRMEAGNEAEGRRPVRIVMTNVVRKVEGTTRPFECDTFFPLDAPPAQNQWRAASAREVSEWVGEEVTGKWTQDGEVEVQMVGFERV